MDDLDNALAVLSLSLTSLLLSAVKNESYLTDRLPLEPLFGGYSLCFLDLGSWSKLVIKDALGFCSTLILGALEFIFLLKSWLLSDFLIVFGS